jgi:hypothetical protein
MSVTEPMFKLTEAYALRIPIVVKALDVFLLFQVL